MKFIVRARISGFIEVEAENIQEARDSIDDISADAVFESFDTPFVEIEEILLDG